MILKFIIAVVGGLIIISLNYYFQEWIKKKICEKYPGLKRIYKK